MRTRILSFVVVILLSISLIGCRHNLTDEGRKGIHNAAETSQERSTNFDAVKGKIGAKNPADSEDVEAWKNAHSTGLAAQAKALSDLDIVVNGVPVVPITTNKKAKN